MNSPKVELQNFVILRDGTPLFEPLDLAVLPGEIVALQGDNGVGKSTLLEVIAGLVRPELTFRGRCLIQGAELPGGACRRAQLGICLLRQKPTAYVHLTVLEQLKVAAMSQPTILASVLRRSSKVHSRSVEQLAVEILGEFGLEALAREKVKNLSTGQRRCLSFASARLRSQQGRLEILLADEPCSGLDRQGYRLLRDLLVEQTGKGCGVIVSEHLGEEQVSLGHRAFRLQAVTEVAP